MARAFTLGFVPVLGQQSRQDGRVVVDDRIRDQSRTLVADLDLDVGLAGEFLLAADLKQDQDGSDDGLVAV
jgi:hypothetical protein